MEFYACTTSSTGINVEGITDAVSIVKIEGAHARRISDLALHTTDLQFALNCLDSIPTHQENMTILSALWNSAIASFCKCFGRGVRSQLSENKILKNKPADAMTAFRYFKSLRNKHLIHDENSYSQSLPGAAINDGSKSYKIEKIICFKATGMTCTPDDWSNLRLLISDSLEWVNMEYEDLCNRLTQELERESYESLIARQLVTYKFPTLEDVGRNRDQS